MPPAAERMSRVDTAWLRMDTDVNLMMIVGVWLLEPKVAYETLCERVSERLLKYRRFRQKVVEDAMGASWVLDEQFDIHRHIVREKLKRRRGAERCSRRCRNAWASWRRRRSTRRGRCGSSTWSRTTKAAAPSSRASTTASPTASR